MGPGDLDRILCGIELPRDPRILVGIEGLDDAGIYLLGEDLALVQTVDFFTPIVDDPFWFGQIAVANALSDVYAMGGRPITAMNIVCFPQDGDLSVLREILRGGVEKLKEAAVALVGGHSVDDPEIKYGLSVTGIIHPEKVVRNRGARPGDVLLLTKPLGTGIIATAIKAGFAGEETVRKVIGLMASLNRDASEAMMEVGVSACTDVTGFGLLGHACEMVEGSEVGFVISVSRVPVLEEALEFSRMGLVPAGAHRNREFRKGMVEVLGVEEPMLDVLFDPQTSGGLLISVAREKAQELLEKLRDKGIDAEVIGEVTAEAGKVKVVA